LYPDPNARAKTFLNALATKCGADNSLANPRPNDNPVRFDTPLLKSLVTSSGDTQAYSGVKIFPSS